MSPAAPDDPWVRAFDAAAGRTSGARVPPDLGALAARLVASGRRIEHEGSCPTRWVRKAEALFSAPASVGARLLALVLDSWATPAAAVRGGSGRRYVRLADDGARLDAEIGEPSAAGVPVRGTVEGLASGATVVALTDRRKTVRAAVREGGVFELVLPEGAASFHLDVRVGRRTIARTPALATRPSSEGPGTPSRKFRRGVGRRSGASTAARDDGGPDRTQGPSAELPGRSTRAVPARPRRRTP